MCYDVILAFKGGLRVVGGEWHERVIASEKLRRWRGGVLVFG